MEQQNKQPTPHPASCYIADEKPPVITGYDHRFAQPKGGRSTPDEATAPDGISGNWR